MAGVDGRCNNSPSIDRILILSERKEWTVYVKMNDRHHKGFRSHSGKLGSERVCHIADILSHVMESASVTRVIFKQGEKAADNALLSLA